MLALYVLPRIRPRHRVYRNDRTTHASPRLPIFRRDGHSRSVRIAALLPSRSTPLQEQVERRLIRTPALGRLGRLGDYVTYSSDGVLEPRPPANEPETVCPDGRWQFAVKSMHGAPTLQQARLVHLIEQGELQRARGRRLTPQSWPRLDQATLIAVFICLSRQLAGHIINLRCFYNKVNTHPVSEEDRQLRQISATGSFLSALPLHFLERIRACKLH